MAEVEIRVIWKSRAPCTNHNGYTDERGRNPAGNRRYGRLDAFCTGSSCPSSSERFDFQEPRADSTRSGAAAYRRVAHATGAYSSGGPECRERLSAEYRGHHDG